MAPSRATVTRKMPPKSTKKAIVAQKLDASSLPDPGQVVEKDETEEKLEKLIFGDEAGFIDSLKEDVAGRELFRPSTFSDEEEHAEMDEDLEGVADEDVRSG
jgi:U3 small nucleolar RNA-associated protein 18